MQGMKIDFVTNTIIITKAFREAASEIDSEEYMALNPAQMENPGMKIVLKSTRAAGGKSDYKGLTYDYMRRFIRIMDKKNVITFEEVIGHYEKFGYESGRLYQRVKEWFLATYPDHKDMIANSTPKRTAA
jgi:hypothetical protein